MPNKAVKKKAKPAKKKQRLHEITKLVDPLSQKQAERAIKKGMAALDEKIDERYEFAKSVVEAQSSQLQQAVDDMVAEMEKMADDPPTFYYKGTPIHAVDPAAAIRMRGKNFYWMAVRLLVACAKWDIRVGDFKPPQDVCGMCGEET